jgi:hypothetical protein
MDTRTTAAVDNEREQIEQYMAIHGLEPHLNNVVNDLVKERPEDPFASMAAQLLLKSERSGIILSIQAWETLSAQAYPALEVTVTTIQGSFSATTAIGGKLLGATYVHWMFSPQCHGCLHRNRI